MKKTQSIKEQALRTTNFMRRPWWPHDEDGAGRSLFTPRPPPLLGHRHQDTQTNKGAYLNCTASIGPWSPNFSTLLYLSKDKGTDIDWNSGQYTWWLGFPRLTHLEGPSWREIEFSRSWLTLAPSFSAQTLSSTISAYVFTSCKGVTWYMEIYGQLLHYCSVWSCLFAYVAHEVER